ncbi:MAG: BACON domain-containing carbohydrate-binding protein, partial [Bacteroidota bacterium]
ILFATYAENTLAATRIAHITVTANGISPVTVTLTQLGTDAVLSILPLIQNVSYQAGIATFAVTSNVTWATVSDASWCQPTSGGTGSGVINAVYGQNETMVTRIAHITVSAAAVTPVNIQVIQQPSYVSISEPDASVLQVFPNPAHYQMHVKFPGAKPGDRYSVENMAGEKILEHAITDPEFIIELSGFPKAAYVLKIMSGNKAIIRKILVD